MQDIQVFFVAGIPLLTLASLFVWFVASNIWTAAVHLSSVPGPKWAAYSRIWLLKALWSEKCADAYLDVNRKYGALARIGPNHLITSDPDVFRQVLKPHSGYERGPWFDCLRLDPQKANIITERSARVHNALRTRLKAGYEGRHEQGFEATVNANLEDWLAYVSANAVSSAGQSIEFDLARSLQWCLIDLVCRIGTGSPAGFIATHSDRFDFQKTLEERLPIVEKLAALTEVSDLIALLSHIPGFQSLLPSPRDPSGIGAVMGLAQKSVDEQFRLSDEKKTIPILHAWEKAGVAKKEAVEELTIALFAGSDTTATSLRALMLFIISNPRVYTKLATEIRTTFPPHTPMASDAATAALPYLDACRKEGLRMFPPVTALRERVVPPPGDVVLGHAVPGGTNIGLNLPGVLRGAAFGPDADVFRPERWLEADAARLKRMNEVHELVFNYGDTRCLGIKLATMMTRKFVVETLRRWDVASTRPFAPMQSRCHGIFYQKDFMVRISDVVVEGAA